MADINVVQKTQRIIVDMAASSVSVINAGPQGPPGVAGEAGGEVTQAYVNTEDDAHQAAAEATAAAALSAHLNDTTDAHDSSAVSVIPPSGMTATDVQAAIAELWAAVGTGGGGDPLTPRLDIFSARQLNYGYGETRPGGLTGGFGQTEVVVTTTADSGAGSLRTALASGNRYITFHPTIHNSSITLLSELTVENVDNFTVDGVGAGITIQNDRFLIESCDNFIIAGLKFINPGVFPAKAGDCIGIRNDNDRLDMYGAIYSCTFDAQGDNGQSDSCVDIIYKRSDNIYVTVADSQFRYSKRGMLIHSGETGGTEGTAPNALGAYYVTLARNYFHHIFERLPFGRDFHLHLYNQLTERYGAAASSSAGASMGDFQNPPVGFNPWMLTENCIAFPHTNGELDYVGATVTNPMTNWSRPSGTHDGTPNMKHVSTYLKANGATTPLETDVDAAGVGAPPYTYVLAPANDALHTFMQTYMGHGSAVKTTLTSPTVAMNPATSYYLASNGNAVIVHMEDDTDVTSALLQFNGDTVGTLTKQSPGLWTATLSGLPAAGTIGTFRALASTAAGATYSPSYPSLVI